MRSKLVFAAAAVAATLGLVGGAAAAQSSTKPSVVKISALASGLKYNKSVLHAHPGRVKIVFTNLSMLSHNVRIESGERELGGTKTIGKGHTATIVTLKKGRYNFYCSVPGHEDAGMRGTLIVR
jgi:plastocyanin